MKEQLVFEVSANMTIKITQQDIDDIMVGALEGGICYWAEEVEVIGNYLGEYASDQISRGGKLIIHDSESNCKWELDLEKFLKGVQLWIQNGGGREYGGIEGDALDCCNIDANDCDSIVQYALFNEIVFG